MKAPDEAADKVAACAKCRTDVAIPRASTVESQKPAAKTIPPPPPTQIELPEVRPVSPQPSPPPVPETTKPRHSYGVRYLLLLAGGFIVAVGLTLHMGIVRRLQTDAADERAALISNLEIQRESIRKDAQDEFARALMQMADADQSRRLSDASIVWKQISQWRRSGNLEQQRFSVIGGKLKAVWKCDSQANFNAEIHDRDTGELRMQLGNINGKGYGEHTISHDGYFTITVNCDRGRWEVTMYEAEAR